MIKHGQTILIDIDTPVLSMLLIKGGNVIFARKDIHLQAEYILIVENGSLNVGTQER